ncbi:MAG TPA: cytosine deaminase, partial [Clostridiales bacterium]|nr:cytosine deaminase [Clostridiales bacterium]
DGGPVVAAHFIFPSEEDIRILRRHGGWAVQCPDATVSIIAGIMPTAALGDAGIPLALGSDLAAGHSAGIYSQAARAVQLSKIKGFYEPEGNRAISFARAFSMATKQSGALFGRVGSLEPGYRFDALRIGGLEDSFERLTPAEIVERFCYAGETKHIRARYLAGKELT